MAKKLYVRFSTAADEKAVFDFYDEHPDPFISKRDPEVWKERIASGAVTMIHDEDGKILAAAISYPLMKTTEEGEAHKWTEIGSVLVARKNIGLFQHLVSSQVMRAWMLEPPEDRFVLDIVKTNDHSQHVFGKIGATTFTPPDDLQEAFMKTITKVAGPLNWYQIGVEAVPQFARNVLRAAQGAKVADPNTKEEFELDYSRNVLVTRFGDALKEVAGQDFGDKMAPDPAQTIKSRRDAFGPS
jgi:hypothetical protein